MLNTALPTPQVRPLCQKPPSPIIATCVVRAGAERRRARRAQAIAHRRVADVERRQDRKQVAADIAGDVELADLLLDQLHRGKDRPFRAAGAKARGTLRHVRRLPARGGRAASVPGRWRSGAQECRHPVLITCPVYSPARGSMSLPTIACRSRCAGSNVFSLLDEFGLAFLDHQHRALVAAEGRDFVGING